MPRVGEFSQREGHGNLVATVSMEEKGLDAYPDINRITFKEKSYVGKLFKRKALKVLI